MLKILSEIQNFKGKRVLVRVDFNVPLKNKKVLDYARLTASLPTLKYLQKKGAKVIVVAHIGRPEGKVVPELSIAPIAKRLEKLLQKKVLVVANWTESKNKKKLENLKNGEVLMLENIRFFPGEEKNDPVFAKELASLADIFVLDGFAVAHRAAASVSGIAKYVLSYAGFLLEKEITQLDMILSKPKKPFVAIIGGAKIETKFPVVKNILKIASTVLVGGAIVNDYWKAKGYGVGESLVSSQVKKNSFAAFSKKQVILPVDVVVGDRVGKKIRVVEIQKKAHEICGSNEAILDIGPETIALFSKHLSKAKTVVWNGAMGYFEVQVYAVGTFEIARRIAAQKTNFTLIGGGETLEIMSLLKISSKNYVISTGGGAMLEYLSHRKLPGVQVVQK